MDPNVHRSSAGSAFTQPSKRKQAGTKASCTPVINVLVRVAVCGEDRPVLGTSHLRRCVPYAISYDTSLFFPPRFSEGRMKAFYKWPFVLIQLGESGTRPSFLLNGS